MTYLKADVVPAPRKLHPNGATGLTTLTELVVRAVRVALAEMGECWGYRADPWLLWGRSVAWQAAGRERPQAERAEGCSTVRGTVTEARMVLRWQGGKRTESECNKTSRIMRFIVSLSPNVSESEGSSLHESERRTSHSEVNIQVKKRKNSGVWTWHEALTSDTPAFPSHA